MPIKQGVKLHGLVPQMAIAHAEVKGVYALHNALCTITSANDSTHRTHIHSDGKALDYRTKDYASDRRALVTEVKATLGQDFDVIFEDEGGENEHMHVEWDPKG